MNEEELERLDRKAKVANEIRRNTIKINLLLKYLLRNWAEIDTEQLDTVTATIRRLHLRIAFDKYQLTKE